MATVLTPQRSNQSASRCRSAVKVPKLRTGSGSRSGPTAATCEVAPMSIAAAWGWAGEIARFRLDRLALLIEPSSAAGGGDGPRDRSVWRFYTSQTQGLPSLVWDGMPAPSALRVRLNSPASASLRGRAVRHLRRGLARLARRKDDAERTPVRLTTLVAAQFTRRLDEPLELLRAVRG